MKTYFKYILMLSSIIVLGSFFACSEKVPTDGVIKLTLSVEGNEDAETVIVSVNGDQLNPDETDDSGNKIYKMEDRRTVVLTANPKEGRKVVWTGATGSKSIIKVRMDKDRSVKAEFKDLEKVEKPEINPDEEKFTKNMTLSITCKTQGATIKYTLGEDRHPSESDGIVYPSDSSYTVPVNTLFKSANDEGKIFVRAISLKEGMLPSGETERIYDAPLPLKAPENFRLVDGSDPSDPASEVTNKTSQMMAKWDVPTEETVYATPIGYNIIYVDDKGNRKTKEVDGKDTSQLLIEQLNPDTEYTALIEAIGEDRDSETVVSNKHRTATLASLESEHKLVVTIIGEPKDGEKITMTFDKDGTLETKDVLSGEEHIIERLEKVTFKVTLGDGRCASWDGGVDPNDDGSEAVLLMDDNKNISVSIISQEEMIPVQGGDIEQKDTLAQSTNTFVNTISDFSIGKYEVSYQLWFDVKNWAKNNGYTFNHEGREGNSSEDGANPTASGKFNPVTVVSWCDAIVWCNAYSEKNDLNPVYKVEGQAIKSSPEGCLYEDCCKVKFDRTENGYRLPTEGEWQFASSNRGKTPSDKVSGELQDDLTIDDLAWYAGNSGNKTHSVGNKIPNELGIHDMSGNVREWCWDKYGKYPTSDQQDYSGPEQGEHFMATGGCYPSGKSGLSVGDRYTISPSSASTDLGFRLCRTKVVPEELKDVKYRAMVYIEGGEYKQESWDKSFNHTVDSFSIGKYEVTYELWYAVYKWAVANDYKIQHSGIEGNDGVLGGEPTNDKYEPVTKISWRDAIVWCNAYSELMGYEPVYKFGGNVLKDSTNGNGGDSCDKSEMDADADGYRLPTEGEWQFVASNKGATPKDSVSGENDNLTADDVSWSFENSGNGGPKRKTQKVGTRSANELEIHDMSGNVWEWCWDWSADYPEGSLNNYTGPKNGSNRVTKGGGYYDAAELLVISNRGEGLPRSGEKYIGLRVLRQSK